MPDSRLSPWDLLIRGIFSLLLLLQVPTISGSDDEEMMTSTHTEVLGLGLPPKSNCLVEDRIKELQQKTSWLVTHVAALQLEISSQNSALSMPRNESERPAVENVALRIRSMEIDKEFDRLKAINKNWDMELHQAVNQRDAEAVKLLVQLGANVNWKNNRSETPLHRAVIGSESRVGLSIAKYLIDQGADVFAKNNDDRNYTFLHYIVSEGSTYTPSQFHDMAEYLISQNFSELLNSSIWHNKTTPIMMAVKNLEVENATLNLLLESGFHFNVGDYLQDSLLSYALQGNRSSRLFSSLIAHGADWKHLNVWKWGLLHRAAYYDNVNGLRFFVNLGLDVNAADSSGNTPLHMAACFGNQNIVEMIQILIENGADIAIRNQYGDIPLVDALDNGNNIDKKKVVELLSVQ